MQWVLTMELYFHHRQVFPRTLINRLPPSRTLDLQFHWFLQLFLLLLPSLPQQNAPKYPTGLNKAPQHVVRKGITFPSPQINCKDCYRRQKNSHRRKKNNQAYIPAEECSIKYQESKETIVLGNQQQTDLGDRESVCKQITQKLYIYRLALRIIGKHAGRLQNASLWQTARCQEDTSRWCKHTAVPQASLKEMTRAETTFCYLVRYL